MSLFKVSDIMKLLEASEFEAKRGYKEKEEKSINDKAYADTANKIKNYYKDVKTDKKTGGFDNSDNVNRHMAHLEYDAASKDFLEKLGPQAEGYPSKQAKDLHKDEPSGNAVYGFDMDKVKKQNKDIKDSRRAMNTSGLKGRELSKQGLPKDNEKKMMGESKNKVNRLTFKKTEFLTEGHMETLIPEEYKVEGRRFVMADNAGNEYLVEWTNSHAEVLRHKNEINVSREMDKMKHLWEYKSSDYFVQTSGKQREREDNSMSQMIERSKHIVANNDD